MTHQDQAMNRPTRGYSTLQLRASHLYDPTVRASITKYGRITSWSARHQISIHFWGGC